MKGVFAIAASLFCGLFLLVASSTCLAGMYPLQPQSVPYSETEQKSFYAVHMQSVLEEGLFKGRLSILEINTRYALLKGLIQKRYGKPLKINLCLGYDSASRNILQSSLVQEGVPVLNIVVPAEMDTYTYYKDRGIQNLEASFQSLLIIGIMHELDHLAYGLSGSRGMSADELDHMEVVAWSYTCDETIRIFVEKGLPVDPSDLSYYQVWVRGGQNMMSREWVEFIQKHYAPTRHADSLRPRGATS